MNLKKKKKHNIFLRQIYLSLSSLLIFSPFLHTSYRSHFCVLHCLNDEYFYAYKIKIRSR
ncbi:hypothetical protein V1477_017028 [Vespula maculifrons]|uniref:Uncharacterized protein n=1 Tax=Vespula maculifrons TaxID=7453 RepID=A0ABD2B4U1_VESMC